MRQKRVLFIIQDNSFTYDNRVRKQAESMNRIGCKTAVICPRLEGDPWVREDQGSRVYYYPVYVAKNLIGYALEYLITLSMISLFTFWVFIRHGFAAVHVCNPPDFIIPLLVPYKITGAKIVFDQHDLVPEIFKTKFGESRRVVIRLALFFEKISLEMSDHVLATNRWHRRKQIERSNIKEKKTTIVRNGPVLKMFEDVQPEPGLKKNHQKLIVYLGNMNDHDGVDYLLRALAVLYNDLEYRELGGVCIGSGPAFNDLLKLRQELGLNEAVRFTGRLPYNMVLKYLATADIGACPDPKTPLSDISTMNKTMDYMAAGIPIVAFDLKETRATAQDAGLYAAPNDIRQYAQHIFFLANNPDRAKEMGRFGRKRIQDSLAWEYSENNLVRVYQALLPDCSRNLPRANDDR